MRKLIIISLLILFGFTSNAQDFKCDLDNSLKVLSESEFELKIVTNTYLGDQHIEEDGFYVYQSGKSRKTISTEAEELVNENYIVQIDRIEKQISVINIKVDEVQELINDIKLGMIDLQDSVWNKQMGKTKVKFELMTVQKKYSYTVKNDVFFRQIDYFINRSTNLIEKIVYYYKQDGTLIFDKAIVDFHFDLAFGFNSNFFSEVQYFKLDGANLVLNKNYDNFDILK
jgi:hypothetical protein